jgi:hypothetical protein
VFARQPLVKPLECQRIPGLISTATALTMP